MDDIQAGKRLENGTWMGVLGKLQSGLIDTSATSVFLSLQRSESFLFTTPFTMEKYAVLMKRPTNSLFDVNLTGLTAGIGARIYGILFAILLFLLLISYLNERYRLSSERNSLWHLLLSLFPCNGSTWPHQFGVTRKILMTTSGFGILVLSSLYQAKFSEQLMVPSPAPEVTLKDIEHYISSGQGRFVFEHENSNIFNYVKRASPAFDNLMTTNRPLFFVVENASEILTHNLVHIADESSVLNLLRKIESELCENYVYFAIDEWGRNSVALVIGKHRADMLESMNAIVAERMSYVNAYIQSFVLSDECSKHIFPVYTPDASYSPLHFEKISGAFVFLFTILCVSVLVLLAEVVVKRRSNDINVETKENWDAIFQIQLLLHIDTRFSFAKRKQIHVQYLKLLEVLDDAD
jgi:hypothetical protein